MYKITFEPSFLGSTKGKTGLAKPVHPVLLAYRDNFRTFIGLNNIVLLI